MAARLDFEIAVEPETGLITGLDQFRQDRALALLLGHDLPVAQATSRRNFTPRTCRCCR